MLTQLFDGGEAGRTAGASLGGWVGKNVFGVDARSDMLSAVERTVRSLLPSIMTELAKEMEAAKNKK